MARRPGQHQRVRKDPRHSELALDRRALVKGALVSGAGLAATAVFAPAVHAAKTLKLGYVSPQTGPLAAFAEADNFVISNFTNTMRGGLKIGNDSYPIEVVVKDSQSNPNRAADVARELIVSNKIDLMLVASTPETTNPVSTMCEVEETPCISSVAPWQPYFIGRQQNPGSPPSWKPFNSTFHFFWGLEDVIAVFTNMWGQLATNKSVGGLFPNDGDGNAWGDKQVGFPPVLEKLGYKLTDPGRYQNLSDNFTAQITAFKRDNCEIVTGVVLPPDFTTFWNQASQQGFKPKIASVGKALLFPVAVEALGRNGNNLSSNLVVAEPPVQVVADRTVGARDGDRLRAGHAQAVDPADRLRARAVRGRGRRAQALRREERPQGGRRGDRRDQARHHRRPRRVEREGIAAVRAEEHRQDAAGRRAMAAARRIQVRHRDHRQQDCADDSGRRQDGADRVEQELPHARCAPLPLVVLEVGFPRDGS